MLVQKGARDIFGEAVCRVFYLVRHRAPGHRKFAKKQRLCANSTGEREAVVAHNFDNKKDFLWHFYFYKKKKKHLNCCKNKSPTAFEVQVDSRHVF